MSSNFHCDLNPAVELIRYILKNTTDQIISGVYIDFNVSK